MKKVEPLSPMQSTTITESAQRKERLRNALNKAVMLNIFEGVDGVAWQNEQRQDRYAPDPILAELWEIKREINKTANYRIDILVQMASNAAESVRNTQK